MTRRSRTTALSLMELLVTMTIIMILIALLLPGLSQMRERGRRTACANNLRQAGIALTMYANEYERYPHQRNPISGGYYLDTDPVHTPPHAQIAHEWELVVQYATAIPYHITSPSQPDLSRMQFLICPNRPNVSQDFINPSGGDPYVFVMSYFYVGGAVTAWQGSASPTYSPRSPDDPPDWALMTDQLWAGAVPGEFDTSHPQVYNGTTPAGLNELFNDGHVQWVNWDRGRNVRSNVTWSVYALWRRQVSQP